MRKKSIAAAAAAALVAGGAQAKSRDPGPPDHRALAPGKFDRILVAGPFLVRVRTGQATSVTLTGPRTMLDDTELVVRDGQLVIDWQEGTRWSRNGNQGVDVDITVPAIHGVTNDGGLVDIDRVQTDRFIAILPSSGAITIHSMDVGELKADLAGSANLALGQIKAKAVDVLLAGSGGVRAAGQVDTATLSLGSSGSFDGPNLEARDAKIMSSGPGTIRASVTDTADIKSFGAGGIVLTGGAKCSVTKLGPGAVRCS
jgi:hypothetical protein